MENVYMQEGLYTLVNSNKENQMDLVKKCGLMDLFMKVSSEMEKRMEKEFINGVNKVHIMVNG